MGKFPGDSCRAVAPLLARYSDPDLTEAEYVALSTHLLRCPGCRERLDAYRACDQRLRALPGVTMDRRARQAVLEQVAPLADEAARAHRRAIPRWPALASVTGVLAVLLLGGVGLLQLAAPRAGAPDNSPALGGADAQLGQSLTAALLVAPPTQVVIETIGEAARATPVAAGGPGHSSGAGAATLFQENTDQSDAKEVAVSPQGSPAARPANATGRVRTIAAAERRLQVRLEDGRTLAIVVADDAPIVLPDGGSGAWRDLRVGAAIGLRLERAADGGTIAIAVYVLP